MASARQVAANRRNASRPRGPLSAESSAAIRGNAVKHGLTAKHVVMQHEDDADYQELRASITMEYQPQTPQEHRFADQIAQNYWRLLRCRRVETATFENRLATLKRRFKIDPNKAFNDDEGISVCMANEPRDFETLRRYETTIERAWYRAIRELKSAQKERRESEAAQQAEEAEDTPAQHHANCTNKPNEAPTASLATREHEKENHRNHTCQSVGQSVGQSPGQSPWTAPDAPSGPLGDDKSPGRFAVL